MATEKDLIATEIDKYDCLQRIKASQKEINEVLEHELLISRTKLSAYGIVVEDIAIK